MLGGLFIEGSRLTSEQTEAIFDNLLLFLDDLIESRNHFKLFDYMLDNVNTKLSKEMILNMNKILKRITSDEGNPRYNVGGILMLEIINKVKRKDLESLLENQGQNKVGEAMILFEKQVPEIKTIEDLKILDKLFYSYFSSDKNTKKFSCTSEEIFKRKTFSGCSDIGLAFSAILRMKGIPTIYVESAKIEWIRYVQENDERQELMQGHIFLEIYLNHKWYLYDPTFRVVYDNYNYNHFYLPRGYCVFAKALNCHEFGVHSVSDEKRISIEVLRDFDTSTYKEPTYFVVDLRNKKEN